jgi:hypothetical protein
VDLVGKTKEPTKVGAAIQCSVAMRCIVFGSFAPAQPNTWQDHQFREMRCPDLLYAIAI